MRQYKDSGIEWIGKIPEKWEVTKLNTLYTQRIEKVSDKDYPPLSVTMQGILPQLENAAKTNNGDDRKLVRVGDFAINSRSDRRGACGISPYEGSVSLINTILKPRNEMNPRYYNWLFHSSLFSDEFYKWGHGIVDDLWTTRWQEMRNITVPSPTLSVQQRIADYLDSKCGEIDSLIGLQEQMIEALKAYKQSVITEAVTRGLHALHAPSDLQSDGTGYEHLQCETDKADYKHAPSDLQSDGTGYEHLQCETDKADYKSLYSQRSDCKSDRASAGHASVKLVPSGIDWIGEIPEGWKVVRLSLLTSKIGSGSTPTGGANVYVNEGVKFLRSQNIYFEGFDLTDVAHITDEIDEEMKGTRVLEGDVLLNITGGSIGRCYFADNTLGRANVNQHVSIIRPKKITTKYLKYYLQSFMGQLQVSLLQTGGNREGLSASALSNFKVLLPSNAEQQSIASYLDEKCADIDRLIAIKQQKIETLKDYKKSVIYEAVTGKTEL